MTGRGSRALGEQSGQQLADDARTIHLSTAHSLPLAEGPARKQGWQEIICRWMNRLHSLALACGL